MLVILLFLMSVRSTVITAISIPLSLLVAMIGLQVGGFSLNIFTLAALTVAVGRVVDDSIVVLENIKRRDTGHAALTPADIVASVKEVAGAVTASTATTVAVFLPVAVVSGVTGELFRPFAVTVAIALRRLADRLDDGGAGARLLVPARRKAQEGHRRGRRQAQAPGWLRRGPRRRPLGILAPETTDFETTTGHTEDETKVTRLQKGYLPVLNFGLAHPVITLAMALVIFVGTLGASTLLKTDFLGSVSDDSSLTIKQELPAGTRLDTMSAAAEKVEAVLAADPDVKDYLTTIGGSIYAVAGTGANTAEITVNLNEGATADVVKPKLESEFAELGDTAGEITITQAANGSTSTDISRDGQGREQRVAAQGRRAGAGRPRGRTGAHQRDQQPGRAAQGARGPGRPQEGGRPRLHPGRDRSGGGERAARYQGRRRDPVRRAARGLGPYAGRDRPEPRRHRQPAAPGQPDPAGQGPEEGLRRSGEARQQAVRSSGRVG